MRGWGAVVGVVVSSLVILITGCGGGSTTGGGGGGSSVTVTFVGGTPLAVASQIGGAGAFTTMTPGSTVTIPVPSGNVKYAIAYLCPLPGMGVINTISVIEATTQDTSSFTAICGAPSLGAASGSASSSINSPAPTADIAIRGNQGFGANIGSASGAFPATTTMPVGSNDVAAIALDSSHNVLGVKIVRSQTIPGTVNGGAGIILGPADQTSPQSLTVTNVPSGTPEASVSYNTANGTRIFLTNSSVSANPQTYQALPAAAAQSGDFYAYESNIGGTGITTTTTSGGGAFTLSLPTPWTFSGPTPAKLPTFTLVYTGFTGQAAVSDQALIQWQTGATTSNEITVTATANFQGASTTITIPDLSAVSGFFGPAPTGTTINWAAAIHGGSTQSFTFFPNPPPNGTLMFVQKLGSFVQP